MSQALKISSDRYWDNQNANDATIDREDLGTYAIAGHLEDPKTSDMSAFMILNSHAHSWGKQYRFDNFSSAFTSISLLERGSFLCTGCFYHKDNTRQPWLTKINEAGEIVWQQTINEPRSDSSASAAVATIDKGFIVVTWIINDDKASSRVIRYNASGSPTWNVIIPDMLAYSIRQNSDGGFIVSGSTPGEVTYPAAALVTSDGKYSKYIFERFSTKFLIKSDALQVKDGNFLMTSLSVITKFNIKGEVLWQRYNTDAGFSRVDEDSLGNLLLGGDMHNNSNTTAAYIAQTDSEGNNIIWDNTSLSEFSTTCRVVFDPNNVPWAFGNLNDGTCYRAIFRNPKQIDPG